MVKEWQQRPHIVDHQDWISSWLQNADHREYEHYVSELGDAPSTSAIDPTTPLRSTSLPTYYEEISPTNTSFSDVSIFDTSTSPSKRLIEDVFCDDIPDTAPRGDKKVFLDGEKDRALSITLRTHVNNHDSELNSLASYDPISEVTVNLNNTPELVGKTSGETTAQLVDPGKPRPTWLTSCSQCIHANLPCSRRAPACSRCRRKGQAALCLLHRRPYPEEIIDSDATWSTTLILLRLKDENEETWKRKMGLADEAFPETARCTAPKDELGASIRGGSEGELPEELHKRREDISWRRQRRAPG